MATISISDLLALSPAERIRLAQDLWDSLPADAGSAPLSPEERQEVHRRLAEHEQDPSTSIAHEEVKARLRARFGG